METVIPVLAGASSLLATGAVLYRCIRPRFPVAVNCHFCDSVTQVPYGNQNCWDCPMCDQYNGFSEDGDYNKPIPAQFAENMNHPISAEQRPTASFQSGSESLLCEKCTQNQLLKVKQLANFVPYEESNYDAEVDAYQRNLEHLYRLCRDCQKKVDRSLRKQDEFLNRKLSKSGTGSPARPDTSQPDTSPFTTGPFCTLAVPWYVRTLRLAVSFASLCLLATSVCSMAVRAGIPGPPLAVLQAATSLLLAPVGECSWYLVCSALLMNFAAIALAGRESLAGVDAASCFLWLAQLALQVVDRPLVAGLRLVVALVTSGVALWCHRRPRYQRAASPTRIRTRRLRPDSSFASSTSSLSRDVSQDVFRDIASGQGDRPDWEADPEFLDPIDDLETLSIGEPISLGERGLFLESPSQRVPSTPLHGAGLGSLHHRLVVSPARFASDRAPAPGFSRPTPGHRYVRHHSFGLPKNKNKPTANIFQPTSQRSHSLFNSNGSVLGDSFSRGGNLFASGDGLKGMFANGGSALSGGNGLFDTRSVLTNSGSGLGIRSIHGTRTVNINSGSVHGNRSVTDNSASLPGSQSVVRSNLIPTSSDADDRASLFSEPHRRLHSNHSNDSSDTSSNDSFVTQSRASTSCPVDTTFSELSTPNDQIAGVAGRRRYVWPALCLLSALLNVGLVGYVLLYLLDAPVTRALASLVRDTLPGSALLDLLGVPMDLLY